MYFQTLTSVKVYTRSRVVTVQNQRWNLGSLQVIQFGDEIDINRKSRLNAGEGDWISIYKYTHIYIYTHTTCWNKYIEIVTTLQSSKAAKLLGYLKWMYISTLSSGDSQWIMHGQTRSPIWFQFACYCHQVSAFNISFQGVKTTTTDPTSWATN